MTFDASTAKPGSRWRTRGGAVLTFNRRGVVGAHWTDDYGRPSITGNGAEGKVIEWSYIEDGEWVLEKCGDFRAGVLYRVRIRTEPRYRPYKSLEEAKHLVGERIRRVGGTYLLYVKGVGADCVCTCERDIGFDDLFGRYQHNGQPCGVREE